jgi:hypothetical protein
MNTVPPPPNSIKKPTDDGRTWERLVFSVLLLITVFQFVIWGKEIFVYLLSAIFDVSVDATALSLLSGLFAVIGSVLIFAGSALWWQEKVSALPYLIYGPLLFVVKNALDIVEKIIVFGRVNMNIDQNDIERLALDLGSDLFQLVFWGAILLYFRYIITRAMQGSNNRQEFIPEENHH